MAIKHLQLDSPERNVRSRPRRPWYEDIREAILGRGLQEENAQDE